MPVIAEVDITLDVPYGAVDYGMLDEIIGAALRSHGVPVLDVQVGMLKPVAPAADAGMVQAEPNSPFAPIAARAPVTRVPGSII